MSSIPPVWIWLGIIACVIQSALFAGLTLAIFSLSQLRLQLEADAGNADAARVLELRKNSNQILATVIWGNVSTNVLLTLLSDAVLAGLSAFFFSAIVITLLCEIIPQAYFSRNALRMTARFLPFLNFYRAALYPLTKPTAMLLDWWLGVEGITYLRERDIRSLIARSAASGGDVGKLESIGARNFLDLDDVPVTDEGELVHAESIISLPQANNRCVLPNFDRTPDDGDALFDELEINPNNYWHRPIVVRDMKTKLGDVIGHMKVVPERPDDDVIDNDLILVWAEQKRIITGADLLGRLLRGIVAVDGAGATPQPADRGVQSGAVAAAQGAPSMWSSS
jgi:hypothetical protein